ncbi:MAG: hypothetical protein WAK36_11275 [Pseudolabrys sp.]
MGMKALNRLLGIAGLVSALLRTLQGLHAQIECHNCGINSRSRDLRANNAHPMSDRTNKKVEVQGAAILKWRSHAEVPRR